MTTKTTPLPGTLLQKLWTSALTSMSALSTTEDVSPQQPASTTQADTNASAQTITMTTSFTMEASAREMNAPIWTKEVAHTTAPTLSEDMNATAPATCLLYKTEKLAVSMNAETTTVDVLKCASTHLLETHAVASKPDTIPLLMESTVPTSTNVLLTTVVAK